MKATEAYKKAIRHVQAKDIDHLVNVGGGWVIMGAELSQALYMDESGKIRGLSPSIKKDSEILSAAEKKIDNGDFY